MRWAAVFFLLGSLVTLLIFGFNTPFLPKFQITYSNQSSWPEFLTAIGTLLAVVVALFGDWIRYKLFPSDVHIVDIWQDVQGNQGQTRLLIRNIGKYTAYEVEVYLNKIVDNGVNRQGFLPVPLIWTHTAGIETKRNLHPNQFGYYLDLCRLEKINDPSIEPKVPLIFGAGVDAYEKIYHGTTILKIVISQKSGEQIKYDVNLEWIRGQDQFVRVLDYRKRQDISNRQFELH